MLSVSNKSKLYASHTFRFCESLHCLTDTYSVGKRQECSLVGGGLCGAKREGLWMCLSAVLAACFGLLAVFLCALAGASEGQALVFEGEFADLGAREADVFGGAADGLAKFGAVGDIGEGCLFIGLFDDSLLCFDLCLKFGEGTHISLQVGWLAHHFFLYEGLCASDTGE